MKSLYIPAVLLFATVSLVACDNDKAEETSEKKATSGRCLKAGNDCTYYADLSKAPAIPDNCPVSGGEWTDSQDCPKEKVVGVCSDEKRSAKTYYYEGGELSGEAEDLCGIAGDEWTAGG